LVADANTAKNRRLLHPSIRGMTTHRHARPRVKNRTSMVNLIG
jgi:hypothetical protein